MVINRTQKLARKILTEMVIDVVLPS